VGQLIVALKLELTALETSGMSATAVARYGTLRGIVDTVSREVHDVAYKLRPTALDDLGLVRTLSNYVTEWSLRAKISVDFHVVGMDAARLPSPIETALYRIIQEALNNVLQHAHASRVSLILEREADLVRAILEDDGKGFEIDSQPAPRNALRLGILGMKERAALVGGEVKIESLHPKGTAVFVRIPLNGKDADE
jgi:signal transduction histidine kinase